MSSELYRISVIFGCVSHDESVYSFSYVLTRILFVEVALTRKFSVCLICWLLLVPHSISPHFWGFFCGACSRTGLNCLHTEVMVLLVR